MRTVFVEETHLTEQQDAALRSLLSQAFPARATYFAKQSWWLPRPQWRLWLEDDGVPVAHLGLERRRIGVGDVDVYVTGVGHVCTDPARRGERLGRLLMDELRSRLTGPAFLTCADEVRGFYEAAGWVRVPGPVVMENVYTTEEITDDVHAAMVLGTFPSGTPFDLRGLPW
jgi:predicted N-acetyltransferase YhbS